MDDCLDVRRRTVAMLSLIAALALTGVLLVLVAANYHPSVDFQSIRENFVAPRHLFAPEPQENALFLTGITVAPVLIILSLLFFNYLLARFVKNEATLKGMYSALGGFLLVFALWWCWYANKRTDFFYFGITIGVSVVGRVATVMGAAVLFELLRSRNASWARAASPMLEWFLLALSMLTILMTGLFCIYSTSGVVDTHIDEHHIHFNAVFHAVVQVFLGKEILVDLVHQYGLYPHLIDPLFRLTGLTVLNFTVLMALLMVLSSWFLLLFHRDVTENRIIAYLGFLAMMYYGGWFGKAINGDPYFQFHPLRYFFPASAVYLAYRYFRSPQSRLYYVNFLFCSIAIIWNFETGLVVFLSWLMSLVYLEVHQMNLKAMALHVVRGLAVGLVVFAAFNLLMLLEYGQFPNYSAYFIYQSIFYGAGFMMLPMPLVHPWQLVLFTYAVGLVYAISVAIFGKNSPRAQVVFFLSIMGTGLFTYYQGRSHNFNLLPVCFPAAMIVTVMADATLSRILEKKHWLDKALFGAILLYFVFCAASLVKSYPAVYLHIAERMGPTLRGDITMITRSVDFVRNNTTPGEEVLMLSNLSGLYHLASRTTCPVKVPGPTELLLRSDLDQMVEYLSNPGSKKVLADVNFPRRGDPVTAPVQSLLAYLYANYRVAAVSPDRNLTLYARE